jgi:DNA helicase-2/ATP-dependent DNA helicase PcrA
MARRIELLIKSGFIKAPKKILGLTFTNTAAGEMIDDVKSRIIEKNLDLVKIMTFHSLSYKILRAYGGLIGVDRDFKILSEIEQTRILQEVSARLSLPFDEIQFLDWRKEVFLKDKPSFSSSYSGVASEIYQEYINELSNNKVDYDNLLLKTIDLFEKHPLVLDVYRSLFQYILVDEFQDTNPLQFKFLQFLVFGSSFSAVDGDVIPIYILADKAQAIYRFQAAAPENVEVAKQLFGCTEIKLDVNYRTSSESIIRLTAAMRGDTNKSSPSKVNLAISADPSEEGKLVIDRLTTFTGRLHDVGVISQTQYALGTVRTLLDEYHIPYVFVPDFSAKAIEKKYVDIFRQISLLSNEKNMGGALSMRIRQIYSENKQSEKDDEVLSALLTLASNFDAQARQLPFPERALLFYNDIFLQLNWGKLLRKTVRDKVFLSTIHGVKGLQFNQIHILGLSCFEHIHYDVCWSCGWGKNIKSFPVQLDDSHNTLYVGATRAQEDLYLYSTQKTSRGKIRKIVCLLSSYRDYLNIQGSPQYCGN